MLWGGQVAHAQLPLPEPQQPVRLVVKRTSWRAPASGLDISAHLARELERAGFKIVEDPDDRRAWTFTSDLREIAGRSYSRGSSTQAENGITTDIDCRLQLTDSMGVEVWSQVISSRLGQIVTTLDVANRDVTDALYAVATGGLTTNFWFRYLADHLMVRFGRADELDVLIRAFDSSFVSPDVVNRLQEIDGAASVLLQKLRDTDVFTREAASRALGFIGDDSAIPHLERFATADRGGQAAAYQAIRQIHERTHYGPERELDVVLRELNLSSDIPGVVKRLHGIDGVAGLLAERLRSASPAVRRGAAMALAHIGGDRSIPDLEHLAATDSGSQPVALASIQQIRARVSVPEIELGVFWVERREGVMVDLRLIALASATEAEDALLRLSRGEPFAEVASLLSRHPTKVMGGKLGQFKVSDLSDHIRRAVEHLAIGQHSTPVPYKWNSSR